MKQTKSILFISNESDVGGAPLLFLAFLRWFKKRSELPFIILLRHSGELDAQFKSIAPTFICDFKYDKSKNLVVKLVNKLRLKRKKIILQHLWLIRKINSYNVDLIYSNTVHNDNILNIIYKYLRCKLVIHAHEMRYVMQVEQRYGDSLQNSFKKADKFIAVSNSVKDVLIDEYRIPEKAIIVIYNGIDFKNFKRIGKIKAREILKLPIEVPIILGVGQPHNIKGCDLFLQAAIQAKKTIPNILFLWLGGNDKNPFFLDFKYEIEKLGLENNIRLFPTTNDISIYYESADIFFLSSREESFSMVSIEAGFFKIPIICFEKTGGPAEILNQHGWIVPYLDIKSVVDKIVEWTLKPDVYVEQTNRFYDEILIKYEQSRMFEDIKKIILDEYCKN